MGFEEEAKRNKIFMPRCHDLSFFSLTYMWFTSNLRHNLENKLSNIQLHLFTIDTDTDIRKWTIPVSFRINNINEMTS